MLGYILELYWVCGLRDGTGMTRMERIFTVFYVLLGGCIVGLYWVFGLRDGMRMTRMGRGFLLIFGLYCGVVLGLYYGWDTDDTDGTRIFADF